MKLKAPQRLQKNWLRHRQKLRLAYRLYKGLDKLHPSILSSMMARIDRLEQLLNTGHGGCTATAHNVDWVNEQIERHLNRKYKKLSKHRASRLI